MDFLQVYCKITNDIINSTVVHFFMLTLGEIAISRTLSRNIHFEVKNVKNSLTDYSDT